MISNAGSRPRTTLALGLAVALGLGAVIASQPALAGVNEADAGLSLPGSHTGLIPQAQFNDEGLLPPNNADAPIIVADKNKNKNKNNKNWNKNYSNKNIYVTKKKVYVQQWKRKPYYGNFFGGVVLGSLLTATAVGIAPPPPRPDLCWYWSDPYMQRGYWDYCPPLY